MKKVLITLVLLVLLCSAVSACNLNNPNNPPVDDPPDGSVCNLSELSAQAGPFYYDGSAKTGDVALFKNGAFERSVSADDPDLQIVFSNNIQVGQGTVTVTAKSGSKKYSGHVQGVFEILPQKETALVTDYAAFKSALLTSSNSVVKLGANIEIPQGDELTLSAAVTLQLNKFVLTNRGTFVNNGKILSAATRDDENNNLVNYGKLVNGKEGKISMHSDFAIVNHGELVNEGEIRRDANNFFDAYVFSDSVPVGISSGDGIYLYVRSSITEENFCLERNEIPYTGGEIVPKLFRKYASVGGGEQLEEISDGDYDVTVENNVNVGKASATFVAKARSKYFYGARTFEFEITRSVFTAKTEEQMISALGNPNYLSVNYVGENLRLTDGLTLDKVGLTVSDGIFNGVFVVNDAEVAAENCSFFGGIELHGGKISATDCSLRCDVSVAVGANLELHGDTYLANALNGKGRVSVAQDAKLFLSMQQQNFDVSVANAGTVFSNFPLDSYDVSGVKVLRKQLAASQVSIANPEQLEYDGDNAIIPQFTFDHSDVASRYCTYFVVGASDGESVSKPTLAGDYTARITFRENDEHYFGDTYVPFTVRRGMISVRTADELIAAMENSNYDRITLISFTVADRQITLKQGFTYLSSWLKINAGATLTVCGALSADKLIVAQRGAGEESGRLIIGADAQVTTTDLQNNGSITVDGTLNNNGDVLNAGEIVLNGALNNGDGKNFVNLDANAALHIGENGMFVNNGAAYFCDSAADGVSGTVHVRQSIGNASFQNVVNPTYAYSRVGYSDVNTATFDLLLDGAAVPQSEYTVRYVNNSGVSTETKKAQIVVEVREPSASFYGKTTCDYDVLPTTIVVNTEQELLSALNNVSDLDNSICNYGVITFGQDMEYEGSRTGKTVFHIRKNTVLQTFYRFDEASVVFAESRKFEWINDGVIETPKESYCKKWLNTGAGKTVLLFKQQSDEAEDIYTRCDEVRLTENVTHKLFVVNLNEKLTLDLNGYSVEGVEFQYWSNPDPNAVVITSKNGVGTLESLKVQIGPNVSVEGVSITLQNLRYGNVVCAENILNIDDTCEPLP